MTNSVAVIFTSVLRENHHEEYGRWSKRMVDLVVDQPGFIDFVSARDPGTGVGITVAYFTDEESVSKWKANLEHREAQRLGRTDFYESYSVKVANVYREYAMPSVEGQSQKS
ncbi:hypothetical protein GALL_384670 [mine drainage metagenome]|uniref:ABM domain-containing protein n=1 Tax=mine drainage metagenome TaxID=410659 RepID=A0A1J5QQP3_9ZZZZ